MKTLAIDIKHSVFNNDTEAIMYVTKDFNTDSFIVAIPAVTFSWEVKTDKDLEHLERYGITGISQYKENLVHAIKEAIAEFE